ncbi:hypothetical protein CIB48_g622 [Xylaria polymorpha]|nr:hypothetical protein CIB48_g622 [Xylaria polymorpha]
MMFDEAFGDHPLADTRVACSPWLNYGERVCASQVSSGLGVSAGTAASGSGPGPAPAGLAFRKAGTLGSHPDGGVGVAWDPL